MADVEYERTNVEEEEDEDLRKMFVGGLSWEANNELLQSYFSQFGPVSIVDVKNDKDTGRSRGFAFVTMASSEGVQKVMAHKDHRMNGKRIDPKPAKPVKEPMRKVFVSGIAPDTPEEDIRAVFATYGKILSIDMPFDHSKGKRKPYVFVAFGTEKAAKTVLEKEKVYVLDRECQVKAAIPKDQLMKTRDDQWNQGGMPPQGTYDGYAYNQNLQYGQMQNGQYGGYPPQQSGGYANQPNSYSAPGYGNVRPGYVNQQPRPDHYGQQAASGDYSEQSAYASQGSYGGSAAYGGSSGYGNQSYGTAGTYSNQNTYANTGAYSNEGYGAQANHAGSTQSGNYSYQYGQGQQSSGATNAQGQYGMQGYSYPQSQYNQADSYGQQPPPYDFQYGQDQSARGGHAGGKMQNATRGGGNFSHPYRRF